MTKNHQQLTAYEAIMEFIGQQLPFHRPLSRPLSTSFFLGRPILCPSGKFIIVSGSGRFLVETVGECVYRATLEHSPTIGRQFLCLSSVSRHLGIWIFFLNANKHRLTAENRPRVDWSLRWAEERSTVYGLR